MQNSMNQRKCSDMVNCKQQSVSNSNYYQSTEGVVLNHIYVANTTLIKLSKGELIINSSNNDMLKCTGESLILIEKNQTLNIKCSDIDNHLEFKLIDISYELMSKMYSLLITGNKQEYMSGVHKSISSRMLCSPLRPGMNEAFDNVFGCLQKSELSECGDCTRCDTGTEGSPLDFTLMFLLSAFTAHEDGIGILTRTVKSSLREKVYNMVKNTPSKVWSLDDVAARLYMSRSTLKRKLAIEQTSFSEIYLDARMCMAARLLRTGDYNITQVSVMCGYNHTSYFITTFKKYFQMTPYTFMSLVNH